MHTIFMKSSRSLSCLLMGVALLSLPTFGCLHFLEDEPLAPPQPLTLMQKLEQRTSLGEWQQREKDLRQIADHGFDFRSENNLSVALAHTGKWDEALERMQTIERTAPGHTETAYNLATVMELRGDLPSAKKWLEEGFERERRTTGRSPLDGTEWLHARILDAEIASQTGAAPPDSVAGLDFGTGRAPQMPSQFPAGLDGKPVSFEEASRSLFEQLHERLEFVHKPNPVVGDLLFDLANAQATEDANNPPTNDDSDSGALDQVTPLLQMALDFGSPRAALAQRRFTYYSGKPNWPLIAAPFLLGALGAGFWQWERWRREKQAWKQMPIEEWEPPRFLPHLEWKNEETLR